MSIELVLAATPPTAEVSLSSSSEITRQLLAGKEAAATPPNAQWVVTDSKKVSEFVRSVSPGHTPAQPGYTVEFHIAGGDDLDELFSVLSKYGSVIGNDLADPMVPMRKPRWRITVVREAA